MATSKTVQDHLRELTHTEKQIRDVERGIKRMRNKVHKITDHIIECIKEGESTGDRFMDYAFARYRQASEEILSAYKKLEKLLSGKKGEAVLVIHRYQVRTIFGGPGHDMGMRDTQDYRVGVLQQDELILPTDGTECRLPTERYVKFENTREVASVTEGNIVYELHPKFVVESYPLVDQFDMLKDILTNAQYDESGGTWNIVVGKDIVRRYFKEVTFFDHYVMAYYRAMKALGVSITSPEIEKELSKEREALGQEISDAIAIFTALHSKGKDGKSNEMLEIKKKIDRLKARKNELGITQLPIPQDEMLRCIDDFFSKGTW